LALGHLRALPYGRMPTLHRIEVRTRPGTPDPRAGVVHRRAVAAGLPVSGVTSAKVYLLEGELSGEQLSKAASGLLADPVVEVASIGPAVVGASSVIEVHPLPGVMDPAAQSVHEGLRTLLGLDVAVSTGVRYDLAGVGTDAAHEFVKKAMANGVVHQITKGPWQPEKLPRGHGYELKIGQIPICELSDEQLVKLSREAHLFLSLDEMKAIQAEYRRLGREPRDIELETLAQTWSEHCVHKTLKSKIRYREEHKAVKPVSGKHHEPDRLGLSFEFSGTPRHAERTPGPEAAPAKLMDLSGKAGHTVEADGAVVIDNLLKYTVARATNDLIEDGVDWTLSVFKDNSGVIELDEQWGVCIKVETHNHPSALEPYGGSATGIGGCIRDIIGTGLGAKPIASTDVFCVGFPNAWSEDGAKGTMQLPPGTLPPRRILTDVVSGVRDYGNRMGIPTVNGAVHFNDRFVGNPLVFCGCIGLIPRTHVKGGAKAGDHIIALGGRTGRDGIHGATFSSAELESTHADEFSHAVQIGNAIEEKRTLDAILRARDAGLYSGMTDCGAGGFSSAVGEMGSTLGATVHLERAPLKYSGLSYTEIWISEAQERMVLAVPEKNLAALAKICAEECVEMADLGVFGTENADLVLKYQGTEVGRLSMHFMHEGIPQPTREARWAEPVRAAAGSVKAPAIGEALTSLLQHPNIASKHWIIRQYDHEVQGNTLIKPLVGPGGRGPGDAAVIEPISGSNRGIALGCGLQIHGGVPSTEVLAKRTYEGDPYLTTLAGIDECIRNLVCVGANPNRIAILDNFCWPSCEKPENLGTLVRASEACYDGAMAYRTPFVSGKDSLNNQLRYEDPVTGEKRVIEIPPTLLITGMGIVNNVNRCVTMDAKTAGNTLLLIGATNGDIGGSHFAQLYGDGGAAFPKTDLAVGPGTARAVAQCIADGLVQSAHDCSDGGLLVAVAEMLIATTGRQASSKADLGSSSSALGALLAGQADLQPLGATLSIKDDLLETWELAFAENPSRYVLEVKPEDVQKVRNVLRDFNCGPCVVAGTLNNSGVLSWQAGDLSARVVDLAQAWLTPLAW
jgi:phosphoribosylformylglycinamidine synthase II